MFVKTNNGFTEVGIRDDKLRRVLAKRDDEDETVKDGKTLHVSMLAMDEMQREIAARDHGTKDPREVAYEKAKQTQANAWRKPLGSDAPATPLLLEVASATSSTSRTKPTRGSGNEEAPWHQPGEPSQAARAAGAAGCRPCEAELRPRAHLAADRHQRRHAPS
jgi:hypothetical protein